MDELFDPVVARRLGDRLFEQQAALTIDLVPGLASDRREQVGLGPEIMMDRAERHTGVARDVAQRSAFKTISRKDMDRAVHQRVDGIGFRHGPTSLPCASGAFVLGALGRG
nr:hypothetical protein [Sphingopyxis sp. PET50]